MPLPKGEFSAEVTYIVLDIVTYKGASYICKAFTGVMGVLPTNELYWQIISQRGEQGDTTECERIVQEIRDEIAKLNPGSTTADAQVAANTAAINILLDEDVDLSLDEYNRLVEEGAIDKTKNYYIYEE